MFRKSINTAFWKVFDPVLKKIALRIRHIESQSADYEFFDKWRSFAVFDHSVKFFEDTKLLNYAAKQHISIGMHSHIRGELSVISPDGTLKIGHHSFLGPGSRIWAKEKVVVGNYVLISHDVDIHDSNAHSLDYNDRRIDAVRVFENGQPVLWNKVQSKPVVVEDDVWIGFKSSILKGVHIGRGSVIAANSVVTKDVPAFSLVAGNPARIVRSLVADEDNID